MKIQIDIDENSISAINWGAKKTVKIHEVHKLIQIQKNQQTNYFLRQDLEAVVICEQSNPLNSSSSLSSSGIFFFSKITIMGGSFEDSNRY